MTPAARPVPASVIVVSRHRAEALRLCLTALGQQDHPEFEVIVVADPAGIAAAQATGLPLRLVAFDEANISAARNAGLALAGAPMVAFIDDDEEPQPNWLAELTACLDRTGADAAFGPKLPEFEGGRAPDWDPQGWRYTLDCQMPADEEIHRRGQRPP